MMLAARFPDRGKWIETRSWRTDYRGILLIHQGSNLAPVGGDIGLMQICRTEPFRSTLINAGYLGTPALPRGAILGSVELVDCVQTWPDWATVEPWFTGARKGVAQHYFEIPPPKGSNERAFGDYTPGRWAWLCDEPRELAEPIAVRGMPGLWTWDGDLPI